MAFERFQAARRVWLPLVPLAALAVLLRDALSPASILFRRDAALYYLPLKEFVAAELREGRLATWYPYDGLGVSLVGTAAAGLFHPSTLLYQLLAPDQALKWQVLLSYAFAAAGTMLLARRLGSSRAGQALAAFGYAASGYLLSVHSNLAYALTAATLPFVLFAADEVARRPGTKGVAALAGALWLSLAGGDVQGALLAAAAAGAVVLASRPWRGRGGRRAAALGAAYAAFALAALPMLVPMWASLSVSSRIAGFPLDSALCWSLHPLRLLELAVGPLLPPSWITEASPAVDALGGQGGGLWAQSELVGLPVCALAAAALLRPLPRRLKVQAALGAAALVLALGRYGGLYVLLHKALPLWSAFRYPEKLMPFAVLSLCLLAGWAARRLGVPDRARAIAWELGLAAVALSLAVATQVAWTPGSKAAQDHLVRALLVAAVLLAALLLACARGRRLAGWAAVGLQAAHALALSGWVVAVAPREAWGVRSPLAGPAVAAFGEGRPGRLCWDVAESEYATVKPPATEERWFLDSVQRSLGPGAATRERLATVPTYGPGDDGAFAGPCSGERRCPSPCSRVAGAELGVVDAAQFERMPEERRAQLEVLARLEDPRAVLYRDGRARPFASLPAVWHLPPGEVRDAVYAKDRRPGQDAIVAGEGEDRPAPEGAVAAAMPAPDRVVAEVRLEDKGSLVLAMTCDPGWSARVDGHEVALGRADGTLCRVDLEPGRHRVVLAYRPLGWPWAFAGPLAAAFAVGCAWRVGRRRTGSP